ncbi:MAG: hypothetical protein PHN60_03875 [Candidatus Gracilibacteria bacterium]|nr:hypothetical protein [Candidatus Gracilibacteria bacterium]
MENEKKVKVLLLTREWDFISHPYEAVEILKYTKAIGTSKGNPIRSLSRE